MGTLKHYRALPKRVDPTLADGQQARWLSLICALICLALSLVSGATSRLGEAAPALPASDMPALHMLVVGINEYEDSAFRLGYARPDAEALAQFFERGGGRLFRAVDVIRLFDREATKGAIQQALDQLADRAQAEDVMLIYLAGHGVAIEQQFYFLAHEMRQEADEEAAVHKYGIPATVFSDSLFRTKSRKQVIILDACNAGNALPILAKTLQAVQALVPTRSAATYLIAASTSQQYAYEIPVLGHGVLAYALLTGLETEAPVGADRIVTISSLAQYVKRVVPQLAARYHDGETQSPVSLSSERDFPLWVR